jgi:hypothetical protein
MGTVIRFPEPDNGERNPRALVGQSEPAMVIILPVVQIERYEDDPPGHEEPASRPATRRRRRRRGTR